jgi:hypothetical protein
MPDDPYLSLSPQERVELLDAASRQSGLAPAILEKDYWVCLTLDLLFSLPDLGQHLVFKGGTSLSKVYHLIERFSEDVDMSFHRDFLGFGADQDPEAATGNKQTRLIEKLQRACEECVKERLQPALEERLSQRLGSHAEWTLEIDPKDTQTLIFRFPQSGSPVLPYIAPAVRIELGARSDHWPSEEHRIESYLGETLAKSFGCASVRALAAERTFWEKATLLHAEAHRELSKPMPQRYARHYHDLARMAESPVAARALEDTALRERVVAHKSVYFRSQWARYDLAVPESFCLVPPPERRDALEADHRGMLPMFFNTPQPMEAVLHTLQHLEDRIRSGH